MKRDAQSQSSVHLVLIPFHFGSRPISTQDQGTRVTFFTFRWSRMTFGDGRRPVLVLVLPCPHSDHLGPGHLKADEGTRVTFFILR